MHFKSNQERIHAMRHKDTIELVPMKEEPKAEPKKKAPAKKKAAPKKKVEE